MHLARSRNKEVLNSLAQNSAADNSDVLEVLLNNGIQNLSGEARQYFLHYIANRVNLSESAFIKIAKEADKYMDGISVEHALYKNPNTPFSALRCLTNPNSQNERAKHPNWIATAA